MIVVGKAGKERTGPERSGSVAEGSPHPPAGYTVIDMPSALAGVDWEAVDQAYIAGEERQALCQQYGINYKTLDSRIVRLGLADRRARMKEATDAATKASHRAIAAIATDVAVKEAERARAALEEWAARRGGQWRQEAVEAAEIIAGRVREDAKEAEGSQSLAQLAQALDKADQVARRNLGLTDNDGSGPGRLVLNILAAARPAADDATPIEATVVAS